MKQFAWILLLIAAVAQPMGKTAIYMLYQVNRSYIKSQLCEQRQMPASGCEGKCFLKKQLKKDEQQKENKLLRLSSPKFMLSSEGVKLVAPVWLSEAQQQETPYSLRSNSSPTLDVFHPPKGIA